VTGALLALPASSPEESTVPPGAAPAGASVQIADFRFGPARTVAGSSVAVVNADAVAHTLTANDGAFGTGLVDGGASVTFTAPTAPGTYEFACEIHPSMTGTLVVD
jgi:plastocyanin